jgi:hypothetical protein
LLNDDDDVSKDAEDPIDHPLVPPDLKMMEQDCNNMKKNGPPAGGPAGKTPLGGPDGKAPLNAPPIH